MISIHGKIYHSFMLFAAVTLTELVGNDALASGGSYGGPISSPKGNPQGDFTSAINYINAGEYKRAIKLLKEINNQVPKNADVLNYLGYSYRKAGDQENGLKYYQKALDIDPSHPGANEYMGELYLEMSNLPKAEERLAVLASSRGSCPEFTTLKASIDIYKGAHPESATLSEQLQHSSNDR